MKSSSKNNDVEFVDVDNNEDVYTQKRPAYNPKLPVVWTVTPRNKRGPFEAVKVHTASQRREAVWFATGIYEFEAEKFQGLVCGQRFQIGIGSGDPTNEATYFDNLEDAKHYVLGSVLSLQESSPSWFYQSKKRISKP